MLGEIDAEWGRLLDDGTVIESVFKIHAGAVQRSLS
jgi:hypothetical protein